MKKLTGLSKELVIIKLDETEPDIKIPTLKQAFLNTVATTRAATGDEPVRLMKMGLDLMVAKDELNLEDADFEILKKVIRAGTPYPNFISGQMLDLLNKTELDAKKPEEKK